MSDVNRSSAERHARICRELSDFSWAETVASAHSVDEGLRLALEVMKSWGGRWDLAEASLGFSDEWSVDPKRMAELPDEHLLAWLQRILESIALMFGTETRWGSVTFPHEPYQAIVATERLLAGGEDA